MSIEQSVEKNRFCFPSHTCSRNDWRKLRNEWMARPNKKKKWEKNKHQHKKMVNEGRKKKNMILCFLLFSSSLKLNIHFATHFHFVIAFKDTQCQPMSLFRHCVPVVVMACVCCCRFFFFARARRMEEAGMHIEIFSPVSSA